MTAAPYLARLNPEQRHAVEYGGLSPLLTIAGAGTGKTNTLAHRVAHLIVLGADPRRMMLLTFSRRAAVEMTRRVERIAANVLPDQARVAADALTWSGTFHAIGARLLREYAEQIGLDRPFTIHDREDSADLMNLVRHDLGLSKTEEAPGPRPHAKIVRLLGRLSRLLTSPPGSKVDGGDRARTPWRHWRRPKQALPPRVRHARLMPTH
jgi:superfamily I DNA/RNA helicase